MTNPLCPALADEPAPSPFERALGAYLGLAVGDALGATVEFMTPSEIRANHGVHRNLTGGGWLHLKPGQVTDDTQMCLAIGRALIATDGWDLRAIADEFVAWMRSRPADIGSTCRRGIRRYLQDGSLAGKPSDDDGGNGAAMRNLPVVLATLGDDTLLAERSVAQAHLTHWHPFSDAATVALAGMTRNLILGRSLPACRAIADALVARHRVFRFDPWPGRTSGYIVDTLQTVLNGFFNAASFEECLVSVVNRGGDADTAGALAGQLAGARFGVRAIPARWLRRLDPAVQATIHEQTQRLLAFASRATARASRSPSDSVLVS